MSFSTKLYQPRIGKSYLERFGVTPTTTTTTTTSSSETETSNNGDGGNQSVNFNGFQNDALTTENVFSNDNDTLENVFSNDNDEVKNGFSNGQIEFENVFEIFENAKISDTIQHKNSIVKQKNPLQKHQLNMDPTNSKTINQIQDFTNENGNIINENGNFRSEIQKNSITSTDRKRTLKTPKSKTKNTNKKMKTSNDIDTTEMENSNVEIQNIKDNTDEPKYLKIIKASCEIKKNSTLNNLIVPDTNVIECVCVGNEYRVGKDIFLSRKSLYRTELKDYTLITDAPFDVEYAPLEIKPLLASRWKYKLHVNPTLTPVITRSVLRDRVVGGQILAYRYTECSIQGNSCVYYGFIPTIEKDFPDSHKICYVASNVIWPRKLYIYLKSSYSCNCRPGCTTWSSNLSNYTAQRNFCIKNIKWSDLYIMMGDLDRSCIEDVKTLRSCEICAQCYNCSNSTEYCRKHRICRHKTAKPLEDVLEIVQSKMKTCIKYK